MIREAGELSTYSFSLLHLFAVPGGSSGGSSPQPGSTVAPTVPQLAQEGLTELTKTYPFFPKTRRLRKAEETTTKIETLLTASPDPAAQKILTLTRTLAEHQGRTKARNLIYAEGFSALARGAAGGVSPLASLALQISHSLGHLWWRAGRQEGSVEETSLKTITSLENAGSGSSTPLAPEQKYLSLFMSAYNDARGKDEKPLAALALNELANPRKWESLSLAETACNIMDRLSPGDEKGTVADHLFSAVQSLLSQEKPKGAAEVLSSLLKEVSTAQDEGEKGEIIHSGLNWLKEEMVWARKNLPDSCETIARHACHLFENPHISASHRVKAGNRLLTSFITQAVREGRQDSLPLVDFIAKGMRNAFHESLQAILLKEGFSSLASPVTAQSLASMGLGILRQDSPPPEKSLAGRWIEDRVSMIDLLTDEILQLSRTSANPFLLPLAEAMDTIASLQQPSIKETERFGSMALEVLSSPPPSRLGEAAGMALSFVRQSRLKGKDRIPLWRTFCKYLLKSVGQLPLSPSRSLPRFLYQVSTIQSPDPKSMASLLEGGFQLLTQEQKPNGNPIFSFAARLMEKCYYYGTEGNEIATIALREMRDWAALQQDSSYQDTVGFLTLLARDPHFPYEADRKTTLLVMFQWLAGLPPQGVTVVEAAAGALPSLAAVGNREVLTTALEFLKGKAVAQKDLDMSDKMDLLQGIASALMGFQDSGSRIIIPPPPGHMPPPPIYIQELRWELVLKGLESSLSSRTHGDKIAALTRDLMEQAGYGRSRISVASVALPILEKRARRNGDQDLLKVLSFAREASAILAQGQTQDHLAGAGAIITAAAEWDGDTSSAISSMASSVIQDAVSEDAKEGVGILALQSLRKEAADQQDTLILPPVISRLEAKLDQEPLRSARVRILAQGLQELTQICQNTFSRSLRAKKQQQKADAKKVEQHKSDIKVGDTTIPVNTRNQRSSKPQATPTQDSPPLSEQPVS